MPNCHDVAPGGTLPEFARSCHSFDVALSV
jgi:hypothetical protein